MCVLLLAGMEDSSDDEPLIKKTTTSSAAQKPESNGKKQDSTNGTENKITGDHFTCIVILFILRALLYSRAKILYYFN